MEARTAGEEVGRLGRSKELPVDSRRRAQRPRNRRPDRPGRAEPPVHPAAGLDLEADIVVVLDLGAEGHGQPAGDERDLVLDEPGEPLSRDARRQEGQHGAVGDTIVDQAVAESPHDVVTCAQAGSVLQIDVVGVQIFPERPRNVAVGAVIVELGCETRRFGDRVRPLRHDVAAADRDVGGCGLADAPIVQIALQGGAVHV